ncbi:MAG: outer membrane beta-barrel protein [Gemmatimonadetes bacterium]|nr:porin family protein [Gemmatimonadota bacterium]NIQ57466.1 porin family protein [Gemmatimonadota bacterium]NIU77630.1 outer membrane beta-barrel protein [Gammaproteobacteria bacterium]NIX47941.1 outer membrane beta-barrel protein [Gemmatimonadota bacterium]NIY11164.1 outer membrane beta-barrel protein [Gemmatimonadota bacterium]
MRDRVGPSCLAAALALALAAPACAQRLALELTAGAAVGRYSETGAGLELLPGPSFGATLEAEVSESLAAYAGYVRSSFGCEEGFCADRDVTLTSQGAVLGGRWSAGLPWVRAGVTLQSLDVDAAGAGESTDAALGWDLGAGIQLAVGGRTRIRPGVAYRRHGASTDRSDGHAGVLALHVGVAVALGGG